MHIKYNRSVIKNPLARLAEVNFFVLTITILIAGIGLAMMFSAGGGENTLFFTQQLTRFIFATVIMLGIAIMPMHLLMDYAYVIYCACLLVLVVVDVVGHIGMGAQRWIRFGGMNLQPSDFMKLAIVSDI